jgi:putative SOS response-associated peptidase YedK
MFRRLLRDRRCLIPADGFYEWQKTATGKVPHWISMVSGEPFFFAGLWDRWHEGGTVLNRETIDYGIHGFFSWYDFA